MELECLVACGMCSPVIPPTVYAIGFTQRPPPAPTASTVATTTRPFGIETGTNGPLLMNVNKISSDDAVDLAAGTSTGDPDASATRKLLTVGVIVVVVAVVSLLLCYLAVDRYGPRIGKPGHRIGVIPRKSAGMYKVSPAPSPTWDFVGSPVESPEPAVSVRSRPLLSEYLPSQPRCPAGHDDAVGSNAEPEVDAAAESWLGAMKRDPCGRTDGSVSAPSCDSSCHEDVGLNPTAAEAGDDVDRTQQPPFVGPSVADVIVAAPRLTMSQASTASTLGSVVDWGDAMEAQIEQRISTVQLAFPRPEHETSTRASTLSHSEPLTADVARSNSHHSSAVGRPHRPGRLPPTKKGWEAPHVPRTSFPTQKRTHTTSFTPPPQPKASSRRSMSWSPRFHPHRGSTSVMPVQTSVLHVQQAGRPSRSEPSLDKESSSPHGRKINTRDGDNMGSVATYDSDSPLCDNVELATDGIDLKPHSVSRPSGTTTIAVEPAPEEVEWINPLFLPFDDDATSYDEGCYDESSDHDQCDARSKRTDIIRQL